MPGGRAGHPNLKENVQSWASLTLPGLLSLTYLSLCRKEAVSRSIYGDLGASSVHCSPLEESLGVERPWVPECGLMVTLTFCIPSVERPGGGGRAGGRGWPPPLLAVPRVRAFLSSLSTSLL